jgi:hypothetical protein
VSLAAELLGSPPGGARLVYGEVTQASPLEITAGAGTTAVQVSCLSGYAPRVGDYIAVLVNGADRLVLGAVDSDGWVSYTPTWTNVTMGASATVGRWQYHDGLVFFHAELTLGAGFAITGNVGVGLPIDRDARPFVCAAAYEDAGTRYYVGSALAITSATRAELVHSESGNSGLVNATNPFTWVAGDDVWVDGFYHPA